MTLCISDQADEFRIEISGRFADSAVSEASAAWKAALETNTPRRVSVDITRMTGYDPAGFSLLRDVYMHGTHIVAGTPRSLLFLMQISKSRPAVPRTIPVISSEQPSQHVRRTSPKPVLMFPARAAASGE